MKELVFKQELLKGRLGETLKRMDAAFPGLINDASNVQRGTTARNYPDDILPEPILPRFQVP